MAKRLGNFIIFAALTILTLGLYPLYFVVTRMQEQNDLTRELIQTIQNKPL